MCDMLVDLEHSTSCTCIIIYYKLYLYSSRCLYWLVHTLVCLHVCLKTYFTGKCLNIHPI